MYGSILSSHRHHGKKKPLSMNKEIQSGTLDIEGASLEWVDSGAGERGAFPLL